MSDPQNPSASQPSGDAPQQPSAYPPPSAEQAPSAYPQQPYASAPPPAYSAPQQPYAAAPPPAYGPPASGSEPGKTLGIIALVAVFFFSLVGLILGYVARSQSKKAGIKNTPATVAIVLGWIFIVLSIIVTIIALAIFIPAAAQLAQQCVDLGPGVHTLSNGVTITCGG